MHATEWIAEHGRFRRKIDAGTLRRELSRTKGQCTWCGQPVGKGRSSWCSDQCVEDFQARCWPQRIRAIMLARDRGVCAGCGLDTEWVRSMVERFRAAYQHDHRSDRCAKWSRGTNRRGRKNRRRLARYRALWGYGVDAPYRKWLRRHGFARTGAQWEADHIVPVIEGGGLCCPAGYRTLCRRCHKGETKALAGRRAKLRLTQTRHPR